MFFQLIHWCIRRRIVRAKDFNEICNGQHADEWLFIWIPKWRRSNTFTSTKKKKRKLISKNIGDWKELRPTQVLNTHHYRLMHRMLFWLAVEYRTPPIWPTSVSSRNIYGNERTWQISTNRPLLQYTKRNRIISKCPGARPRSQCRPTPFANNSDKKHFHASEICSNSFMLSNGYVSNDHQSWYSLFNTRRPAWFE